MRVDVLEQQTFYAGPLGRVAQAMIARRLAGAWPDLSGQDVLGYGYTTPYLDLWRTQARRVLSFMPATQGVERWPSDGPNLAVIGEDERLPFMEALFDRVLCVHALEEAEAARPLLRELWRVLAPEGRMILVVANRRGLWSRADHTPFGHGRPFSKTQLAGLLGEAMFQPVAWTRALYAPPITLPLFTGAAPTWEATGERLWPTFGGVLMVEAVKRLYGSSNVATERRFLLAQPARARFQGSAGAIPHKKWAG
jgi:SAM-dependent methyltransferase